MANVLQRRQGSQEQIKQLTIPYFENWTGEPFKWRWNANMKFGGETCKWKRKKTDQLKLKLSYQRKYNNNIYKVLTDFIFQK